MVNNRKLNNPNALALPKRKKPTKTLGLWAPCFIASLAGHNFYS
jgi:hypothetical protein